jgi:hypothetical protein
VSDDAAPPVLVEEPEVSTGTLPATPAQRLPGGRFAPGHARLGGRKKRVPDSTRTATIEQIISTADPVGRLCRIAAGKRFRAAPAPGEDPAWMYPTPADQLAALRILAGKVLPDLRAVDVKTDTDKPPLILNFVQATKVTSEK